MAVKRTPIDLDLPLVLDREASESFQRQLTGQLRHAILGGQLAAGARLPSTRALATALGIARNVAIAAYDDLFADGYLVGRPGSGTYVAADLPPHVRRPAPARDAAPRWLRFPPPPMPLPEPERLGAISFQPGIPAIAPLAADVWRAIWRRVAAQLPPNRYGSPAGEPELRAAIAGYLGRARAVACRPADVVVTGGALQALDLVARATLGAGASVGIEDPGYPLARQVFAAAGATIIPLPVDDDGVQVERLPQGPAAPLLAYVSPSHQYPLGVRLSVARRIALLAWAEANDSLIVEDDYDSEFRFDATPLPSLAGLDTGGRVVYIGTFSKVLSPALRVGYLVAPPALHERVVALKRLTDFQTSWPVQRALATFVAEGHLERHIRRMRRYYAANRAMLRAALAPIAHLGRLRGMEAGLHAYLELREGIDPARVVRRAYERGVIVTSLDEHYLGPPDRHGLLLGYGGLTRDEIATGAGVLMEVIREVA